MRKMSLESIEMIIGGVSRSEKNAGCAASGLADGIASGLNLLVGGLTPFGCLLTISYD